MICHICNRKINRVYKFVKNLEIIECRICQLGVINKSTNLEWLKQNNKDLYNFESYKKEEEKLRGRFKRLAKIINIYKKSGKVLDIGAGFGLISSILVNSGRFNFDLIEPFLHIKYFDKSKFKLIKSTFEKFKPEEKKYDVTIMMDVLEHFKDPLTNLKKANFLLNDGGILVIQTPNYKCLMAMICHDWAWWMIEDHKFFFSTKSLKKILNKTSFKVEYFITYEDWYDFKKNLDGNFSRIKNSLLRKSIKGIFFSVFFPVYFLFRKIIWKMGYGGLMFVVATKRKN